MSQPVSTEADRIVPRLGLTWHQLAIAVLALLGLVLVWTRFRHIGQSFWHDEAYTALYFAGQGPDEILTLDSIANSNNHVLFSLLAWATGAVLAPTEAVYRAWSVIPGAVAVAVATWWTWRRLGIAPALILATLIVAAPLHAEQTSYARGYGLVILAGVAVIIGADALARRPSVRTGAAVTAAAVVGVATLYSFALVALGHVLALLAQPRLRRPLLFVGGASVLAAVFLFGPVVDELADNRPVGIETIPLLDALRLAPAFDAMAFVGAPGWIAVPALAVAAYAVYELVLRDERDLALNLLLPPLVVNVVFSLVDAPNELRYQLIVLPHVLLLIAIGLAAGARAVWRLHALRPATAAVGVAVVLALCFRMVEREEVGHVVPVEDPRAAAEIVAGTGITRVLTDSLRPQGLQYYLGLEGIEPEVAVPGDIREEFCKSPAPLIYIHHEPLPLDELPFFARPAPTGCLARRGAIAIPIPQRQLSEPIEVWILPEDGAEPNAAAASSG